MGKEPRAAGAVPMDSDGALEIVPMTLEDIPAVLEIERGAHGAQPGGNRHFFVLGQS